MVKNLPYRCTNDQFIILHESETHCSSLLDVSHNSDLIPWKRQVQIFHHTFLSEKFHFLCLVSLSLLLLHLILLLHWFQFILLHFTNSVCSRWRTNRRVHMKTQIWLVKPQIFYVTCNYYTSLFFFQISQHKVLGNTMLAKSWVNE